MTPKQQLESWGWTLILEMHGDGLRARAMQGLTEMVVEWPDLDGEKALKALAAKVYDAHLDRDGQLHVYKVGMMSDAEFIRAPSGQAAVVFYAWQGQSGNALGAVIYSRDGESFMGDGAPFFKYVIRQGDQAELEQRLDALKTEVQQCEFVEDTDAVSA